MKGEICSEAMQRAKYIITDLVMTAIAFFVFNICRYYIIDWTKNSDDNIWSRVLSSKLILEDICVPIVMLAIYALSGFYNHPFSKSRLGVVSNTLCTAIAGTALIYLVILLNDIGVKRTDYLIIIILIAILFTLVYIGRYIISDIFFRKITRGVIYRTSLIIGNTEASRALASQICDSDCRFSDRVIGFVRLGGETDVKDSARVWNYDDLPDICSEYRPDQIVITTSRHSDREVMELVDGLIPLGIPVKIAPDTLSYVTSNIRLSDILGTPLVDLTSPQLSDFQNNLKRVLDILAATFALIILSPLCLAIAVAVKFSSPGPVFYSQQRLGKRQVPFSIYKFRTMVRNAEPEKPMLSSNEDPRITSVGRILRKFRLDELPQFWNVLIGDMSLVGPRPEREYFVRQIMREAPYYALIFQVRPGITSWGMVKYGYASNVSQMVERARYDLIYLNNMSILTDLKILIYTIRTVISGEGK